MRLTTLLGLLATLAVAPPSLAQTWPDDSAATRLPWGSANVVLVNEGACGLFLWAETTQHDSSTPQHRFRGFFPAPEVYRWLEPANALLRASSPPPDGATALATPPLTARNGRQLILRRERDGNQWRNRSRFYFLDPMANAVWFVEAPPAEAQHLLQTMFERAGDSPEPPLDGAPCLTPTDTASAPRPLGGGFETAGFPHGLVALGDPGDVWLRLVVLPDGTVERETVRVLSATHEILAREVLRGFRTVRFRPAVRNGRAVRATLYFHMAFEP